VNVLCRKLSEGSLTLEKTRKKRSEQLFMASASLRDDGGGIQHELDMADGLKVHSVQCGAACRWQALRCICRRPMYLSPSDVFVAVRCICRHPMYSSRIHALVAHPSRIHVLVAHPCTRRASMYSSRIHVLVAHPCTRRASMYSSRIHVLVAHPCNRRAPMHFRSVTYLDHARQAHSR
jgi:hypothetical protein